MSDEREQWQPGQKVVWGQGKGPHQRGEIVAVHYCVVSVRWETGAESIIAAASPWLKRVGQA